MKYFLKKHQFIIATAMILIVAAYLQTLTYANRDATWLTYCTNAMLEGKKYYIDFFETNPPLILILYIPAILIGKLFHLTYYTGLEIYTFFVLGCIVAFSHHLLKKYFGEKEEKLEKFLIIFITFCFSILPFFWFAEREQYTIMLALPYFIVLMLRQKKQSIKPTTSLSSGLLAGVGFSLKPYFLVPLIMLELYYWTTQKKWFAWFRIETITIFTFMVVYLISAITFFPEYFHKMLPMVLKLYTSTMEKRPLLILIFGGYNINFFSLVNYLVILTALFSMPRKKDHNIFYVIFLIASIGFYIAYLWQGQIWYYHIMPAMILAFIPLGLIAFTNFSTLLNLKNIRDLEIKKSALGFCALVLILLQTYQAFYLNGYYFFEKHIKYTPNHELIGYIKENADNKTVLIISGWFAQESARYYTDAKMTSRFPSPLVVPGITYLKVNHREKEYLAAKKEFFNMMMSDIKKRPPTYVFIEKEGYWIFVGKKYHIYSLKTFFLSSNRFKDFFKHFHLVKNGVYYWVYKKN